jgi:hypothetical protein
VVVVEGQFASLSVLLIEGVASTMIATLYWAFAAPLIDAVDVAVSVSDLAELMPNMPSALMKNVGMVTVCCTWRAL